MIKEKQTVLICDDDQDILAALKIYLSAEGYNILEANNGSQVLDILAEEEVHLILLDIMMPVLDGIDTTKIIREKIIYQLFFLLPRVKIMTKFSV